MINFAPERPLLFAAMLAVSTAPLSAQASTETDSAAVVQAAEEWVGLLDAGETAAAFEHAAPLLRRIVGSEQAWEGFVKMARADVPKPIERELVQYDARPDLPGAPAGEYRSVGFLVGTDPTVTETVIMVSTDSGWKAAMYGVRAPQ